MRRFAEFTLALSIILTLSALVHTQEAQPHRNFKVEKTADGVYAIIRTEPPSLWFNPNNKSFLREMIGLLDSIKQQSEASAKRGETLEQLRKSIDVAEFQNIFAGDSQPKKLVFEIT